MDDRSFERFGGICAVLTAAASFAFAAALYLAGRGTGQADLGSVRLEATTANWLLALMGLLATGAIVALYYRLRESSGAWMLWAALLGVLGSIMTTQHAMYDAIRYEPLSNAWRSGEEAYVAVIQTLSHIPNAADPRGIGSLLLTGIFALVVGMVIVSQGALPKALGQFAMVWAVALFMLFLTGVAGDAVQNPFLRTGLGAISFGLVGPAWWLLVGRELLSGRQAG